MKIPSFPSVFLGAVLVSTMHLSPYRAPCGRRAS